MKLCGLAPPLEIFPTPLKEASLAFLISLHTAYVVILAARKLRDQQQPALFIGRAHSNRLHAYPHHQPVGPLPPPGEQAVLMLATPTRKSWRWELTFMTGGRWLKALRWLDEPGTVTYLELVVDFEEFPERTLLAAPQVQFRGHTLSLQERARVLRLVLTHLQKLVKKVSLHPVAHMTRCGALIPLGGPAVCGLNRRPYFTCRQKMIPHIRTLTQYYEATWITCSHTRPAVQRPYVYRARKTREEVEEARL